MDGTIEGWTDILIFMDGWMEGRLDGSTWWMDDWMTEINIEWLNNGYMDETIEEWIDERFNNYEWMDLVKFCFPLIFRCTGLGQY